MTILTARFCVGCGQVFDDLQPPGRLPLWITADAYRKKHGYGFTDLHLIGEACPPCARQYAMDRRTSPSEMACRERDGRD